MRRKFGLPWNWTIEIENIFRTFAETLTMTMIRVDKERRDPPKSNQNFTPQFSLPKFSFTIGLGPSNVYQYSKVCSTERALNRFEKDSLIVLRGRHS